MAATTRAVPDDPVNLREIKMALDDEACWQSVVARDAGASARFCYGVVTTGIYCRPGCPSRLPLRENVRFFEAPAAARAAGLRACRRCHPDQGPN